VTSASSSRTILEWVIYRDFDQLMAEGLDAFSLKNGVV
jgi:hypothetical protein